MIIQTSNSLPPVLKEISAPPSPSGEITPGLLTGVDHLLKKRPNLYQSIAADLNLPRSQPPAASFLVVKPEQVPDIFDDKTLKSIKTIASQLAKEINPHLKFGIDALWLVYSLNNLRKDWKKPDWDTGNFIFEVAGIGLGALGLANSINSEYDFSEYKISDEMSYGLDVFVKSGKVIYQGKPLPMNELLLSKDKANKIPMALMSLAGIALDPEIPNVTAVPLTQPEEKRESSVDGKN